MTILAHFFRIHEIFVQKNAHFFPNKNNMLKINGNRIVDFRKKQGWTQQKMADLIGVSFRTIQNYEGGGSIPESKQKLIAYIIETHENQVKKKLSDFSLIEIMDYMHENRDAFLKKESFRELLKSFSKDIALADLTKEVEMLKDKLNKITKE